MKRIIFAVLVILLVILVSCEKEPKPGTSPVTYTISTAIVGGKGSVVPDKLSGVILGSSVNFKFTSESGYSLYSVKINWVKVEDIYPSSTEVQYTVRDVNTNLYVEVSFVKTDILLLSKLEPAFKLKKVHVYRADNNQYLRSVVLTQEEKARKLYHYYPSMDVKVISSDGSLYWSEKWDLIEDTYKQGGQILKKITLTENEFSYQASPVWSNADNCYIYYVDFYERN